MTIEARIICDSISKDKKRLTTFELYYPRFIHAEFMTHRVFSRNTSSSRAIPVEKIIEMVKKDPAMPVRWGLNGRGMKDHGEMTEEGAKAARRVWMDARDAALRQAHKMLVLGEQPHKQIVNRILEPFAHIRVVVTASSFANFFTQRCDDAADPTINALAKAMYAAFKVSTPKVLAAGMWHLPYIQQFEWDAIDEASLDQDKMMNLLKVSVARCARTSYRLKNGMVSTFEDDLLLYDRLVTDTPVHGSPAEHQATPDTCRLVYEGGKLKRIFDMPELSGNLGPGWVQYRQTLPNQNIIEYLQEDAAWLT